MDKQITLYTKSYCPYCIQLKDFLNGKEIPYKDFEVDNNPELHQKIIKQTGHTTVPAVFVGDDFIGGSEEFYDWLSKNF